MRENFADCMRELWRMEGGYADHASDPGGATKYGITIDTLSAWRKRRVTKADVQALTREEAEAIYKAWYWTPVKADDLPGGLDAVAFDAAVNSGVSRSAKWLQGALGVTADGLIGPATLAAARKATAPAVIARALDARLAFMKVAKNKQTGKPLWPVFGKGWQRRIDELRVFALHLAAAERPTPRPIVMPRPVDHIPTIKPLPSDAPSVAIGVVLTIVAVIIAVLIASNGG